MINNSLKKTVLIVDDMPENIDIINGILRRDYSLKAATSGAKAIDIATAQSAPDLILLDVIMPGMDGYEVCRRLKENISTRNIPIIFVTGRDNVGDE